MLVAGQDITDWASWAFWPQERVSDPLVAGVLRVTAGSSVASPATHTSTLSSTMTVRLSWTGGGDLDLAVREFNPDTNPDPLVVAPSYQWRGIKADPGAVGVAPIAAGGLWGTFSADSC